MISNLKRLGDLALALDQAYEHGHSSVSLDLPTAQDLLELLVNAVVSPPPVLQPVPLAIGLVDHYITSTNTHTDDACIAIHLGRQTELFATDDFVALYKLRSGDVMP